VKFVGVDVIFVINGLGSDYIQILFRLLCGWFTFQLYPAVFTPVFGEVRVAAVFTPVFGCFYHSRVQLKGKPTA
jgi:hypothetical protein